jgi:hypothetical protein
MFQTDGTAPTLRVESKLSVRFGLKVSERVLQSRSAAAVHRDDGQLSQALVHIIRRPVRVWELGW